MGKEEVNKYILTLGKAYIIDAKRNCSGNVLSYELTISNSTSQKVYRCKQIAEEKTQDFHEFKAPRHMRKNDWHISKTNTGKDRNGIFTNNEKNAGLEMQEATFSITLVSNLAIATTISTFKSIYASNDNDSCLAYIHNEKKLYLQGF